MKSSAIGVERHSGLSAFNASSAALCTDSSRSSKACISAVSTAVDCSSNMLTNLRLIISMGIDEIPAMPIFKPYMDTAMTRKPGIKVNTFR